MGKVVLSCKIMLMNKRHLHHIWTIFRRLKPWYFVVLTLVCGTVAIAALRSNNQHMLKLRDTLYQVDKQGGDYKTALNNLRGYVYGHMNTNLVTGADAVYPPIQLKYTYDRLVQQESARVNAANQQVYTDAQTHCEQLYPDSFSGGPRVPCITDYVNTHGIKAQAVPDDLYKFSFISPWWSPDLAGWSTLLTVVSALLFIISFVADWWLERQLK